MLSPQDSDAWAKWFLDFVPMLKDSHLLSVILVAIAAGWVIAWFWHRRQIKSAKSETEVEQKRVTYWKDRAEEGEKQYLRLKEVTHDTQAAITFIQGIEPELARSFAQRDTIVTIVNPLDDPALWKAQVPFEEYRRLATLAFAASSGFAVSTTHGNTTLTTSTVATAGIAHQVISSVSKKGKD
jgi:hypothetical protein